MLLKFYLLCMVICATGLFAAYSTRQKELQKRIITLIVLLQLLCGVLWAGSLYFLIGTGIVLSLAIYELGTNYTALSTIPVLCVSIGGLWWFIRVPHFIPYLIPAFLLLSVAAFLGSQRIIQHWLFFTGFSLCFLTVCAASLVVLHNTRCETILLLVLLIDFNDAFGYLFGKKFGRHKLFKTLSPGKSLEGYLFGALGLVLAIVHLHTIVPVLRGDTLTQDIILVSYMFIAANMGDLLFSSLKRKLGIKDFGKMLPGHGGILDRMDNVFFSAPLFYVLVTYQVISFASHS